MLENETSIETRVPEEEDQKDLTETPPSEDGTEETDASQIIGIPPIAAAIDKLIHRVLDIRFSGNTFVPGAAKWQIAQLKKHEKALNKNIKYLDSGDEVERVVGIKNVINSSEHLERLEKSELVSTLATGHFLSLFSAFDAFTGELLTAIYTKKTELYNRIEKSLTVSELLKYEKIDDIKTIILQNEIESFRRKSYVDQFDDLEKLFNIKLKSFENWANFVEFSQRRNLLTHCDGLISDQYLKVCKQEGCNFDPIPQVGEKLRITRKYLEKSCNIMIEVALKLGQTLWRKLFEEELELADQFLQSTQYDFLKREDWGCSWMAGEYATSLPKHSEESYRLIMIVNLAIAQAFSGKEEAAQKTLAQVNWSTLCYDFKLAHSVISNNYEYAAELMIKIGKKGEYIDQSCYHIWPLFKHFRESSHFQESYNAIYGIPFVTELKRVADEAKEDSEAEIEKIKSSLFHNPEVQCTEEI